MVLSLVCDGFSYVSCCKGADFVFVNALFLLIVLVLSRNAM